MNPAVKLLEYFEGGNEGFEGKGVVFEIKLAQRDSKALRNAPEVLKEGYVQGFVEKWLQKWRP